MTSIQPLADRVVIESIEQEERAQSGLFIPENAKEKPQQGRVLAVGPGAFREDGMQRIPMDTKIGDIVLFARYAGVDIKLDGKNVKVIKETEILGIVVQ